MRRQLPLVYSDALASPRKGGDLKWWNVAFQLSDRTIISLQRRGGAESVLRLWAPSPNQAGLQFAMLRDRYFSRSTKRTTGATIVVLSARPDLETRAISVKAPVRDRHRLELNYGKDFAIWSEQFIRAIRSQTTGLTVFHGPAGTGKTTYLRFLAYRLRRTHRFYYVPVDLFPLLAGAKAVDLWLAQNAVFEKFTKVVVLEDAETLLTERNRTDSEIAHVLNATDGFLADVVKVHLICTTNCSFRTLDPAVVRPGRLVAIKQFPRLPYEQAQRVAQSRGQTLQFRDSYSLAELYNSTTLTEGDFETPKKIGFGAGEILVQKEPVN